MVIVPDNERDERLDILLAEERLRLRVAIKAMRLAFKEEVSLKRKSSHAEGSIIETDAAISPSS